MKLSDNDARVMRAAVRVQESGYDGFSPHGAADWVAVRRLVAAGLLRFGGFGVCEDCDSPAHRRDPTESQMFIVTADGARTLDAECHQ